MNPLNVRAFTATTAVGHGNAALWRAITAQQTGLRRNDLEQCQLDTFIGRVADVESVALPANLQMWDCRNNRLAWLGLNQDGFLHCAQEAVERHGPSRVALVLGTSTASIASTEEAYRLRDPVAGFPERCRNPRLHSPNSLVGFVAQLLGITGPQLTVATACSSSARVFGSAQRLIQSGVVDVAIVGGVDSLCLSVMYGFHALELMSSQVCRPFDTQRDGLNIGEAAGFALLEKNTNSELCFIGYGESSDAFHMSTPHPEGLGAQQSMQSALQRAGVSAQQIDYINMHGTATRMNDSIEARAIKAVFARPLPCSSTKAYTGHTLGAAGIVEAVVSLLSLEHGMVPGSLFCQQPEPEMQGYLQLNNQARPLRYVMSNSFGFGGNNCSLIFSRAR